MKLMAMAAISLLGTNVWARQSVQSGPGVSVCLADSGHTLIRYQATAMAAKMYAAIGVTLDWQTSRRACKSDGVIHIELTDGTPEKLMPGALAYAMPFEGVHIRIFFDRLERNVPEGTLPFLLAHVMVHEIGHILQGVSRHSLTGVMKARWMPEDYRTMQVSYLPFTDEDVLYIRNGLEARAARPLTADVTGSK